MGAWGRWGKVGMDLYRSKMEIGNTLLLFWVG